MTKQCGYCVYMDVAKLKDGQFKCEKQGTYKFANSDEAERCYKYCERFRRDMYLGEQAVKTSKNYIESHQGYTAVGCYITTIIVNILGLDDNCEELNVLREFRKDVLQKDEKYKDLLIKYDAIGPVIASCLIREEDAWDIALDLFMSYIKGTVFYIKKEEYDKAVALYTEMMNNLIKKYLNSYMIPGEIKNNYDMNLSGHGRLSIK